MEGNGSKADVNNNSRFKKVKIDRQVLPDDLVYEIFIRLSVKTLVRFKYVSKWWYGMIKDPKFIEDQLKHGSSRMLVVMENKHVLSFHELDSLEVKEVRPKLPIHSALNIPKALKFLHCLGGSWSKGILCIVYNQSIRLWNPALHESKILPPRPRINRHDGVLAHGFGITCTGEFKIILIKETYIIYKTWIFPAFLYSSSTNSWKRVSDAPEKIYRYAKYGHALFFSGACHWYTPHTRTIASFNITTEIFEKLELPYGLRDSLNSCPIIINDCLAVVSWNSSILEVWVMKEYRVKESWTKQHVIQLQLDIAHKISPFLALKNDERLLFVKSTCQLACVSIFTDEIKSHHIGVWLDIPPFIYEESLVGLN